TPGDSVWLFATPATGGPVRLPMAETEAWTYEVEIPAERVSPGLLRYWIVLGSSEGEITFPGAHPGNPRRWDYYHPERWESRVIPEGGAVELFDAARDYDRVLATRRELVPVADPGRFAIRLVGEPTVSQ